jgi:hypothetical protein
VLSPRRETKGGFIKKAVNLTKPYMEGVGLAEVTSSENLSQGWRLTGRMLTFAYILVAPKGRWNLRKPEIKSAVGFV